jgi:hypothetical protein
VHRRRLDREPAAGRRRLRGRRPDPRAAAHGNECFAAQWAWAESLPGEPAVYLNVNAPGAPADAGRPALGGAVRHRQATSACGRAYGVELARYALDRMPLVSRHGGRPMVWMDVEGPYTNGPVLADGYAGAVAVNRAVLGGAVDTLRRRGPPRRHLHRPRQQLGQRLARHHGRLPPDPDAELGLPAPTATRTRSAAPVHSATGGPVVMVQVQPDQSGEVVRREPPLLEAQSFTAA